MATIIVEDGTGKTDSNSYGSESGLAIYAADRGITIIGTAAVLLITGMDYIEIQPYQGQKNSDEQALVWPRFGVWVNGFPVDNDEIPVLLVESHYEACIAIDGGTNPIGNVGRSTKREKLGDLEVEYMDGARSEELNRALESKLQKLLKTGAIGISAVTRRA